MAQDFYYTVCRWLKKEKLMPTTWAIQWQHTANIVGNTLVEALSYLISPYNNVT
jgi:hypothetical protein